MERLRSRAARNRRSLNREAIDCLESVVGPKPEDLADLIAFFPGVATAPQAFVGA